MSLMQGTIGYSYHPDVHGSRRPASDDLGAATGADKGALNVRRPVRVGPGSGDQQIPDWALLKRPESSSSRRKEQCGVMFTGDLPRRDVGQGKVRKHRTHLGLYGVHHLPLA
jgi:hypothetical protein